MENGFHNALEKVPDASSGGGLKGIIQRVVLVLPDALSG